MAEPNDLQNQIMRDFGFVEGRPHILVATPEIFPAAGGLEQETRRRLRDIATSEDRGWGGGDIIHEATSAVTKGVQPEVFTVRSGTGERPLLAIVVVPGAKVTHAQILSRWTGLTEGQVSGSILNKVPLHEFIVDHEIAHGVYIIGKHERDFANRWKNTRNVTSSDGYWVNEQEPMADSYAILRNMQRHGLKSPLPELMVSLKGVSACKGFIAADNLLSHYTSDAVAAAAVWARAQPNFAQMTPPQLLAQSIELALTHALTIKQRDTIKSEMTPADLQEYIKSNRPIPDVRIAQITDEPTKILLQRRNAGLQSLTGKGAVPAAASALLVSQALNISGQDPAPHIREPFEQPKMLGRPPQSTDNVPKPFIL